VRGFLIDRQQRVKLASDCFSEWSTVPAGVPQGTKHGPWLYLLMINDVKVTEIWKYVDDTTVAHVPAAEIICFYCTCIRPIVEYACIARFSLRNPKLPE
jgi:hypothetical protein